MDLSVKKTYALYYHTYHLKDPHLMMKESNSQNLNKNLLYSSKIYIDKKKDYMNLKKEKT